MLLVFFSWVPYMQISDMIPGVIINGEKVSVVNRCEQSWGVWGCSEAPAGVLVGVAPYKSLRLKIENILA